jgi:superfamily II DNA/RNA helicase
MTQFTDFNLHDNLMKSLNKMGFEVPTPIQEQFIPEALKGKDVMASAQTGSGKTAAFLLPAFQQLLSDPQAKKSRRSNGPRVLVLTPTRELASQVMQVAEELQSFTKIDVKSVTGGVSMAKHVNMFRKNIDVLVATPGRMVDLMNRGIADLSSVEIFVLDEADRMLDMGFSKDVLTISNATAKNRQTMLLSATLDGKVGGVIKKVMQEPVSIELAHATKRHDNITQCLYLSKDREHKNAILDKLIQNNDIWQGVIFMATKRMTEKMAKRLATNGESVAFLHGDMRQSARNGAIKKMQKGEVRFLIATDVAARGLDIDELTHVINFDLPQCPEDYIHRIGRVGRAGRSGEAITLVSNDQRAELSDIEHLIGVKIEQKSISGLEYVPSQLKEKKSKKSTTGKGGARRGKGGNGKQNRPTDDVSVKKGKKFSAKKPNPNKGKPKKRTGANDGEQPQPSKWLKRRKPKNAKGGFAKSSAGRKTPKRHSHKSDNKTAVNY